LPDPSIATNIYPLLHGQILQIRRGTDGMPGDEERKEVILKGRRKMVVLKDVELRFADR